MNKTQKGFSLIEILLVIGVIAALAIAAFLIYGRVRAAAQANEGRATLQTIAIGMRNTAGVRANYFGFNELTANRARIIPASMTGGNNNTTDIRTPWGEGVVILN